MFYRNEIDTYYLILKEEHFQDFKELAITCNDFLLKNKIRLFRKQFNYQVLEMDKIEYCMMLIQIRKLSHNSPLIARMLDLGTSQDNSFHNILDQIEMETKLYSILDH